MNGVLGEDERGRLHGREMGMGCYSWVFPGSLSDRKLFQGLWLKCFLGHVDKNEKMRKKGSWKENEGKVDGTETVFLFAVQPWEREC